MMIWLSYLLVFVGGYLIINYIPQLFDLGMQHLVNTETFKANRMQKEMDKDVEEELLPSQIGFQQQYDDDEVIYAEDNKIKK